jgi:hypothetical protein
MIGANDQLLRRLCTLDAVTSRGFTFERLRGGDILVHRRGCAYGVWQTRANGYRYIPAGNRGSILPTGSVSEALDSTTEMFKDE